MQWIQVHCAPLFEKAISVAETKFECRTVGIVTDNEKKWNRCARSYTRWTIRLSLMDVPLIC